MSRKPKADDVRIYEGEGGSSLRMRVALENVELATYRGGKPAAAVFEAQMLEVLGRALIARAGELRTNAALMAARPTSTRRRRAS